MIHEALYWLKSALFFSAPLWNLDGNLLSYFNHSLDFWFWFLTWNIYIKRNLVHSSMSLERCVAVRTQEVTFDSQLKSHTGEPFNFQATSLNCLCCCSSTFIVRTWLNRAGGAWRARGARGALQFLATIESKHIFKKSTIIWRNLPLSLEFDIWSSKKMQDLVNSQIVEPSAGPVLLQV